MERLYLNVFLLKKGVRADDAISLKGLTQSFEVPLEDGNVATLRYGHTAGAPEWFERLAASSPSPPKSLPSASSISGILVAEVDQSLFAVAFGHGWQRVRRALVEPNFGLRCVLNLAERNKLKSIRRDRIADDFVQAIEQVPDADDIYRFDIDTDKDLLTGVSARVNESLDFGLNVSGADSFKASIDLSRESIGSFLRRCELLYRQSSYQKRFPWVDNIRPVRDEKLAATLAEELAKLVIAGSSDLALCIPDLIAWDEYDLFTYQVRRGRRSPVAYELSPAAWKAYAVGQGVIIDASALRTSSVYAYKQANSQLQKKWSVLECLHGSVVHNGVNYLAHGGKWFELDKGFVSEIDKKIRSIAISSVALPKLASLTETEGVYNDRAAASSGGKIFKLDKNHGGGKSRIEVCDLLLDSGEMVCVKPWGGNSASLSHLFQQAQVAAKLISEDDGFNAKVKVILPATHHTTWDSISVKGGAPKIVLAVLRGPSPDKLPFFARISLAMCVASLRQMRFEPSYLRIS
ncbi:DUF6119 family protein [Lysobacter arvi]|uniref:TIGR04141 family sporadically distributed protein n=1 Tax=Lysobacter arvi TaxID=3038776 RepID=A0ABU1CGL6_9GAMM|nr:DUF6119 family protein [Lysobacter arvi]MDR0184099.1 TIGR04141 family sporadically distributed protein [Lysobacter arvi]